MQCTIKWVNAFVECHLGPKAYMCILAFGLKCSSLPSSCNTQVSQQAMVQLHIKSITLGKCTIVEYPCANFDFAQDNKTRTGQFVSM